MATYTITITTKFEHITEEEYSWWIQRQHDAGIRSDVLERVRLTGEGGFTTKNPHGDSTGTTTYKVERHAEAP